MNNRTNRVTKSRTTARKRIVVALAAALAALPLAAAAQIAFTSTSVALRAGPDGGYPQVARIYPGAEVRVYGCIADWTWCDVSWGYERGWVWARSLQYPYQGGRVPIYGYGPRLGLVVVPWVFGSYWDNHYRGRPWYERRSYWEYNPPPRWVEPRPHPGYRPEPVRPYVYEPRPHVYDQRPVRVEPYRDNRVYNRAEGPRPVEPRPVPPAHAANNPPGGGYRPQVNSLPPPNQKPASGTNSAPGAGYRPNPTSSAGAAYNPGSSGGNKKAEHHDHEKPSGR